MKRFRDHSPAGKVAIFLSALGCSVIIVAVLFGPLFWFLHALGSK